MPYIKIKSINLLNPPPLPLHLLHPPTPLQQCLKSPPRPLRGVNTGANEYPSPFPDNDLSHLFACPFFQYPIVNPHAVGIAGYDAELRKQVGCGGGFVEDGGKEGDVGGFDAEEEGYGLFVGVGVRGLG